MARRKREKDAEGKGKGKGKAMRKKKKKKDEEGHLIRAESVYSLYKGKEGSPNVVALRGLNLKIKPGELVSVVGPSGSGKSTLLRIIGGLQAPSAGHIYYRDRDITKLSETELVPFRRTTVGYVFQEGNLIPTRTALENVIQTLKFAGRSLSESRERAVELMELLGIKERMNAFPGYLSGGERQRVAIARALANRPEIILADEPTGNLDYANAENVMKLIRELREKMNMACLVVTHSKHVSSFTDRSVELRDGRFIGQHGADLDLRELGNSRQVFISPDGTLTLPPETLPVIDAFGELWDIAFESDAHGNPKLVGVPANSTRKETKKVKGKCPVCNSKVKRGEFYCNSCGAKLG